MNYEIFHKLSYEFERFQPSITRIQLHYTVAISHVAEYVRNTACNLSCKITTIFSCNNADVPTCKVAVFGHETWYNIFSASGFKPYFGRIKKCHPRQSIYCEKYFPEAISGKVNDKNCMHNVKCGYKHVQQHNQKKIL